MTTRADREKGKKLNEINRRILQDLMALPENAVCADCPTRGPRWASWNLGIFVCIKCSGVHRSIGVHISKVRSITLDMWQPDWVASMQKWGNKRANAHWEYHMPADYTKPNGNNSSLESFIRAKYERKKWCRKASDPPLSDDLTPKADPAPAAAAAVDKKKDKKEKKKKSKSRSSSPTLVAAAPVQKAHSLLDFFDTPAPAQQPVQPAMPQVAPAANDAGFGDFVSNTGSSAQAAAPAAFQVAPPAGAQQNSKDDIMKLFSSGGGMQQGGMQQGGMAGGMMNPGMYQQGMGMQGGMMNQGMMNQGMGMQGGMMNQGMGMQGGMMNQGMGMQGGMMNQGMGMQGGMMNQGMMQQQNMMQQQQQQQPGMMQPMQAQMGSMSLQPTQSSGATLNSNLWN